MNEAHPVLRVRRGHQHFRVSFVELFYDLVFVFAVTQLSHALIEHFTLVEGAKTLLLLMAVWTTWIYTTWATNWLNPDNLLVRLLLFALMLAGLILSSSIPKAFDERGLAFAGAYVFTQVSRSVFVYWSFRHQPAQHRNFLRISIWLSISGIFWVAGGVAEGPLRAILWVIAAGLEFLGPIIRFWLPILGRSAISDWEVEGAHMAERCGLFVIIALGESLLVTGSIFSELEWTAANVMAFVASFVGSLLLWWLYFDRSAEAASEIIAEAQDSGRLALSAYTYSHLAIVAGIVLLAVADEFILAHPLGHTDGKTMIALLGGTAIYMVGNMLFKWTVWGRLRLSHGIGLVGLALLVPVANLVSPLILVILTTLLLVVMAVWEAYAYRRYAEVQSGVAAVQPE